MIRDLARLAGEPHDLLVIGGGIYGACVAWDAALRGLSVALLEQGDFGQATSANSQKIVHGGFRYLQHADLTRMRESIRERRTLLRVAPHLVHPLPMLIPTYRWGIQHRQIMRAALAIYDLVSWDRNRGQRDPQKRIPRGRVVSRAECLRLAPGLSDRGLTGGAVWHDGQIYNTERLTLAFIRSAAEQGACAANYVQVTGLLQQGASVTGVRAIDRLSGRSLEVRGRLVINTAGPWVNRVLGFADSRRLALRLPLSKTVNVITRPLTNGPALSVTLPRRDHVNGQDAGERRLYITPWRGWAIVGSAHRVFTGAPEACQTTEAEIAAFVADINTAYPGAGLTAEDITFVHVGLLPCEERDGEVMPAHLARRYQICDHKRAHGVDGFLSVVGVKYTTARDVAQKAVTVALKKLGRGPVPPRSAETALSGGDIDNLEAFLAGVLRARPYGLDEDVLRQLVATYGSDYARVLHGLDANPTWRERVAPGSPVLKAQIVYAVREEMAQRLGDVVLRRTELGTLRHPGMEALKACADLMAEALGWDSGRIARELDETDAVFTRMGIRRATAEALA